MCYFSLAPPTNAQPHPCGDHTKEEKKCLQHLVKASRETGPPAAATALSNSTATVSPTPPPTKHGSGAHAAARPRQPPPAPTNAYPTACPTPSINCPLASTRSLRASSHQPPLPQPPLPPVARNHPSTVKRPKFFSQSLVNSHELSSISRTCAPACQTLHPPPKALQPNPHSPAATTRASFASLPSAVMRPKFLTQSHTISRNLSSNAPASLRAVYISKNRTNRQLLQIACSKNPTAIPQCPCTKTRDLRRRRRRR